MAAQFYFTRNPANEVSFLRGRVFRKKNFQMPNIGMSGIFRPFDFHRSIGPVPIDDPIHFGAVGVTPEPDFDYRIGGMATSQKLKADKLLEYSAQGVPRKLGAFPRGQT